MNMRLTKDCKHGQLQSTCEICAEIEALVQERDANARLFLEDIKTVEAERDIYKTTLERLARLDYGNSTCTDIARAALGAVASSNVSLRRNQNEH